MSIDQVCKRNVAVVNKDATLFEAAGVMREYHVGTVIVIETKGGAPLPVGILTDRDIVMTTVAKGVDTRSILVRDVMTYDLATIEEGCGIYEAAHIMKYRGVRRLPVVNNEGVLVGVVSANDVLELLTDELATLSKLSSRQSRREKELRV